MKSKYSNAPNMQIYKNPNIRNTKSILKVRRETSQATKVEPLEKITKAESSELLSQKVPPEILDWVLNKSM